MPYYQIELTPMGAYYFGDEKSFNSDNNANYFVKSRRWPQQTTLLGALRYDILQRNGLLQKNPGQKLDAAAEHFIGKKGFRNTQKGDYGQIKRISAVQLKYEDDVYIAAPMDAKMKQQSSTVISYASLKEEPLDTSLPTIQTAEGKAWSAKQGTVDGLVKEKEATTSTSLIEWYDKEKNPLVSSERVGIIKKRKDDEDSKGFYRQLRYKMKPGWSFVLYAEIDDDGLENNYTQQPNSSFPMGGERVPFRLKATRLGGQPKEFEDVSSSPAKACRVLLTSDAHVEDISALLDTTSLSIMGDPMDFRAIFTSVEQTEQYNNLSARGVTQKSHRARFSSLLQMIPRGSVFHVEPDDWQKFQALIHTNNSAWTQIGYNSIHILG